MGQMASNLGNPNITDPRQARPQDLDASEKGARVIAQGTRGLAQGFSNYQNQNSALRQSGGGMMPQTQGQQPVDPSYFQPMNQGQLNRGKINPLMTGNNLSFYGDSNG